VDTGEDGAARHPYQSRDIPGRVYEYFLSQFASAEGKKGGQFYTPRCIVQLLVEMLAPWKGRVFDPCGGLGGMFVQSVGFVKAHATGNGNGGKAKGDLSIFGQESNPTTWRLAKMNLAIRGIEGDLGDEPARQMREAGKRGEDLELTEDELAFYDALEVNDSAVKVMGEPTLCTIARELVETIRNSVTIDWTEREAVRAKIRVAVKRILRKHGYPPDKQEKATQTVLQQAELLCADWAA
jgi:hypothetical protein